MSFSEWTVIFGGLTAIAWINWYFFMAQAAQAVQRPTETETTHPSRQ